MRFKPNRGLRKKGTEDNSVHFVGIQTHDLYCAEMYMQNLFDSEINSQIWYTYGETYDFRRMNLHISVDRWNFLL